MSDSDEEKVLLDDESMDEVHEVEDALRASVDTSASFSPMKKRLAAGGDWSSGSGSEDAKDEDSSSDDDDGCGDFSERLGPRHGEVAMGGFEAVTYTREEASSDEDSDEPPEIPGSPIAQKLQVGAIGGSNVGATSSSGHSPLRSDLRTDGRFGGEEEDEYEVKEVEQPRAAEFHASSSSEDEDELGSDRVSSRNQNRFQLQNDQAGISRPKTAAKDLEKYRDVVPNDFFQQFRGASSSVVGAKVLSAPSPDDRPDNISKKISRESNGGHEVDTRGSTHQSKYVVNVPEEVENLFSVSGTISYISKDMRSIWLTDAYTPEDIELETRLEPFLPEFIPSVGLPFDGIQIPRPDGKEDNVGVEVLHEPSGQTNVAELELLMQVNMDKQHKLRSKQDVVRSIERSAHRPQEIDQWIASVAKVQYAKPMAQVSYKKSMPPIPKLMEYWPEEFENYLASRGRAIPVLSELDVNLKEMVKLVCVMLDIPVYEGNYTQCLHLLFSLYLEIETYERDAQRHRGSQR